MPSLYDDSVEVVGADDVLSPPSSALGQNSLKTENTANQPNLSKVIH